ncbi:MAG: cation transporting ATPase C-terminal domain-containing protein, partial [Candidatus Phytoplasma australasiaticum]|nr:cation transporting ATPase C-terminal domain-containing protein [Candidatus Phytoplasma australasiaticum]
VIFSQIGNVFACRSDKFYFWQTFTKKNRLLFVGILCELILFILISQNITIFNSFFGTTFITWQHYLYLSLCILIILIMDTIYKFITNNMQSK